ncbi:MAG: carboxypeptidase-like regulatory domain-containing protein [Flavobacteriia bacterium]|nr:carboxypeptidase-like regulatory domain-containing protein [Flavobacteriia bacterium]
MKKIIPHFLCLLFSFVSFALQAQNDEISASIINAQTQEALESVHIINLSQIKGAITNKEGKFTIPAAANDTLLLSYLGFKTIKVRVTNDMFAFQDTQIALTELAYALEEVVLKPYQLTGYLEIDIKKLPVDSSFQYSISGLNVSYESGKRRPSSVSKVLGAILNPADLLRNLFGKKPRQMRKLRQMKEDDYIKDLLATKFDRETLIALLQIEEVDIQDILSNCNYSKSFIKTANDLQILDAISGCYEEYRVLNRNN